MDISQLKYFITVAQTLSLSEAARRCGISQPAMSYSIVDLEKQLGAELFIRSRKGVTITEAGMEFLPDAIEIVNNAEKAVFRVRQLGKGDNGRLSISALTTSSAVLSRCLAVFSKRCPDVLTDITFTSGRSQVLAMNEQKYDFHFAVQEMVPAGETFQSMISHHDYLCVAMPADHPLANEPLDFSRLKGERYIDVSETDGPALYNEIRRVCAARNYEPNVVCQYDRAEAVLLSVGAGVGISIIPEALSRVFYAENVKFIRIPGSDTIRTYVIAWHTRMTNPSAKRFLEVVQELFENK